MPRRYKKRNYRKRPYRSRNSKKPAYKRKNRPYTIKTRQPIGIPDKMMLKLNYTEFKTLEATSTNWVTQNYRGNGMYDPDYTNVGHQPLGFDQWTQFYNKYRVYASKIVVTFLSRSNTTLESNIMLSVIPSIPFLTTTYEPRELVESPYSRYRLLGTANAVQGNTVIKSYMSTKKLFGESELDDVGYTAFMTADPVNQWSWNIGIQNMQGEVDFPGATIMVKITYYAELFERVQLHQS